MANYTKPGNHEKFVFEEVEYRYIPKSKDCRCPVCRNGGGWTEQVGVGMTHAVVPDKALVRKLYKAWRLQEVTRMLEASHG